MTLDREVLKFFQDGLKQLHIIDIFDMWNQEGGTLAGKWEREVGRDEKTHEQSLT
jgi:rRNA processing protein Krr1/Pno1